MAKYLGIDFGTTNSVCAVSENGRSTVLKIEDNGLAETLRSVLYMNPKHETVIGKQAIDRYLWDVENLPATPPIRVYTGRQVKVIADSTAGGFGGTKIVPEIVEVDTSGRGRLLQSLKSVLGNSIYKGTEIFNKEFTLEDLLTILLKELKIRSELATGEKLDRVIIGRPVRYVGDHPDEQLAIKRMETIAKNAGFDEVQLEYEPVGAALSFGIDIKQDAKVLIFDFGGGTLDVCVMKFPEKKILAVAGRAIGGDLLSTEIFKHKLLHYFGATTTFGGGKMEVPRHLMSALENWYSIAQLKKKDNIDSLDNLISKADGPKPIKNLRNLILSDSGFRIYQEIDQAKIRLSDAEDVNIHFDGKSFVIDENLTRGEFEQMIQPHLNQTQELLNEVLIQARLTKESIDKVITTGGSSNIPVFKRLLTSYFTPEKVQFGESFTSVASGLAIRSNQVFGGS
jgi:hypothetical chaperone protein